MFSLSAIVGTQRLIVAEAVLNFTDFGKLGTVGKSYTFTSIKVHIFNNAVLIHTICP